MKTPQAFVLDGDRYAYDSALLARGYRQFATDQDAWYFGVWTNDETMTIVTYAEGDEAVQECESRVEYVAAIKRMDEFYGAPPPAFVTIDEDGTVTNYHDERSTGADPDEEEEE